MGNYRIPVSAEGALMLPDELREELHIKRGDVLIAHSDNGRLVLDLPFEDRVKRAQALVRSYVGDVQGVVDDFIASRRIDSGE